MRQKGGSVYLSDLYAPMRFKGMSKAQTDRAVDDLAESGRAAIFTTTYGGLAVRLRGAA